MYNKFQLASNYLNYFFAASNGKGHGMHSPFIFDFIISILNDKQPYPDYNKIESLRRDLLGNNNTIVVQDLGAGSSVSKSNERTIASIAKNAAKPKKYSQLLYRMVQKYKPATLLELGTSLGITSSYLSLANPAAKLVTLEGAPGIAAIAKQNFENLQLPPVDLVIGNFDDTLSPALSRIPNADFVFIDGNHRREPTERYFLQLLSKTTAHSIFVFDDIHWSREMEDAWEMISSHPAVRCSIDLFFIGIIFFREEFLEKQHFAIRF